MKSSTLNIRTKHILLLILVFTFIKSQSQAPANIIAAQNLGVVIASETNNDLPTLNHISCDALRYNGGNDILMVFAWDHMDGDRNTWAYDDGSGTPVLMTNQLPNGMLLGQSVEKPEIALVSVDDGNVIYAVLAYNYSGDVWYEAYEWTGSAFVFNQAQNWVTPASSPAHINVAGDQYGHFAIVCDDDGSSSIFINQLTGYLNGGINFNNSGAITFDFLNNEMIYMPDVDITFEYFDGSGDFDATIYLTFITDAELVVAVAAIKVNDLDNNLSWDIIANHDDIGYARDPNDCTVDHPTISVMDGAVAWIFGTTPVAAVSFALPCSSSINLFPASIPTAASNYVEINSADALYATSKPRVVAQPTEGGVVTSWNYFDNNNHLILGFEGLSHLADFDPSTFSYDPTLYLSLQVQSGIYGLTSYGNGETKLTTISGFKDDMNILYCYFDDNTAQGDKFLEYKIEAISATSLRKTTSMNSDRLSIYPNPVISYINIDINDSSAQVRLIDVSGQTILIASGDQKNIETKFNQIIPKIDQGIYFIKVIFSDGKTSMHKMVKR